MKIIEELIIQSLKDLDLSICEFSIDHPKDEGHGDYSCNVAMIMWGQIKNHKFSNSQIKSPRELATQIAEKIGSDDLIEKVEVAGPGFINFYLKQDFLINELNQALSDDYGKNNNLKAQKTYVEFTDPNPFKEFHIGHLMSNTIGESLARILEANGAIVKRANYQGDVGLHVAKSIWGLIKKSQITNSQISNWIEEWKVKPLKERIGYLGQAYAYGAGEYETSETAKAEMNAMNKEIYDGLDGQRQGSAPTIILEMYDAGRAWSLEYFETIYARLGTKFEEYFFESEEGPVGLKIVEEGLKKGVLEIGESGAIVFKGEKYGLHTRVFRNKLGLPTYEAKELALPTTKYERWAYDKSYIITANEIDEYFKVLIQVLKLMYPELGEKTTHLSHGMMRLKTGKMSSRTGKVVTGEGLLNELKEVVLTKMGERAVANKEVVADQVAIGALKYTVLKQTIGGDIAYEPVKMTNMEGDTGPYLQYTYARTQSVLRKAQISNSLPAQAGQILKLGPILKLTTEINKEELSILKWIYRYSEVVAEAGAKYAPQMVAGYIAELAQRYNTFYNQHQIVGNEFRLVLTRATGNILKSGLDLLGIVAPEEM